MITGVPEKTTFPPVDVLEAVLEPALIITAPLVVSDTVMLLEIVKFPDVVEALKVVRFVVPPITPDKVNASVVEIVKAFAPLIVAEIVCVPDEDVIVESDPSVIAPE